MLRRTPNTFWSGVVAVGVLMLLVGVFWNACVSPRPAYGQVPDSGAQRIQMINELKATNAKLAEIAELLKEIRTLTAEAAKERKAREGGG